MRPYVILNAAMTLDGKIATKILSSEISGPEDLKRVHGLRKEVDGIMVGINTILSDDPRLTVHKIPSITEDHPTRIVVDSKARTPLNARILNGEAPTIIATSLKAPSSKVDKIKEKAEVYICGPDKVDLTKLMVKLKNKGINNLMLEGGSTLNFSMLDKGLVDEVRVAIAPMIVGGSKAKTLVDGKGIDYMQDSIKLKLERKYVLGIDLILEYSVLL